MRFFLVANEVLAEIEAPNALAATFDIGAEDAPRGSALVELRTGSVVAWRRRVGWVFTEETEGASAFDEEAPSSQRRGAA